MVVQPVVKSISSNLAALQLATISMHLTTKGGQQAIEGIKQQLQTTVSSQGGSLWDTNPPPVQGSVLATGPGTTLAAFNTKGAGGDPEEVRRYLLMCCMVVGVPETFLADVSTGNLATATTLVNPATPLVMWLPVPPKNPPSKRSGFKLFGVEECLDLAHGEFINRQPFAAFHKCSHDLPQAVQVARRPASLSFCRVHFLPHVGNGRTG